MFHVPAFGQAASAWPHKIHWGNYLNKISGSSGLVQEIKVFGWGLPEPVGPIGSLAKPCCVCFGSPDCEQRVLRTRADASRVLCGARVGLAKTMFEVMGHLQGEARKRR